MLYTILDAVARLSEQSAHFRVLPGFFVRHLVTEKNEKAAPYLVSVNIV